MTKAKMVKIESEADLESLKSLLAQGKDPSDYFETQDVPKEESDKKGPEDTFKNILGDLISQDIAKKSSDDLALLKLECLRIAHDKNSDPKNVLKRAESYYLFTQKTKIV